LSPFQPDADPKSCTRFGFVFQVFIGYSPRYGDEAGPVKSKWIEKNRSDIHPANLQTHKEFQSGKSLNPEDFSVSDSAD
jgi:hypothetical protein